MKIKALFIIGFLSYLLTFPVFGEVLKGEINFVWDKLTQEERNLDIENIKNIVFKDNIINKYDKKEFKTKYKDFKNDIDYKNNMFLAKNTISEFDGKIIVPFYFGKILVGYGIIYKNDLKHCYYYNALGKLFVVEIFEKNYNDYPVVSYQYNMAGVLQGIIYANSDVDDYVYLNNGNFNGRWYKENFYTRNGKIKMTRILPKN